MADMHAQHLATIRSLETNSQHDAPSMKKADLSKVNMSTSTIPKKETKTPVKLPMISTTK